MEKQGPKEAPQVHHVSKAPKPITALSGTGGWRPPSPKRTEVPPDWPPYFPEALMVETKMILHEACREFTVQTRTSELCKYVISKMTPLFSEAVRSGMVKASTVDGHMERLLHSVIVHNCDYSREGYNLEREARNSDEMFKLTSEVVRAASGYDPLTKHSGTDRRSQVDAYIEEVLRMKSKRITRKDIWQRAGYKSRTEFERWERKDPKNTNKAADETFTRILREKPHLK